MNYISIAQAAAQPPAATPAQTPAPATPAQTQAQTAAAAPSGDAKEQTGTVQQQPQQPADGQRQGGGFLDGPWVMMLLLIGIFYFMMIRPQQRKEKERRKMISEIRAGARVLMTNGFVGTVKEARDNSFLVEIAPGVNAEVVKSAVQQVVSAESATQAK